MAERHLHLVRPPADAARVGRRIAQDGDEIRGRNAMDGAETLEEAARRLEAYANWLRRLHGMGWTLLDPVDRDSATLCAPQA